MSDRTESRFPAAFEKRMRGILGEEYGPFEEAMFLPESVHGLLLNRGKEPENPETTLNLSQLPKIGYCEDGRIVSCEGWGAHPLHRAGAYYLQDPAAMGPVCSLEVRKGWKILDLCAYLAAGGFKLPAHLEHQHEHK